MSDDSFADSCAEMIHYMLNEQTPELHQWEVEEERWFIELGEKPAFQLAQSQEHLGDLTHFILMDAWPYLYRQNPEFFERAS